MEALRRAHRLTCLLLAWFAMNVGVAVAAPVLLSHDGDDVVCSASGALMLMPSDDGAGTTSSHGHDCHLCVMVGAPPVPLVFAAHQAPAESPLVPLPVPVARQAPVPFQQRGPPLV